MADGFGIPDPAFAGLDESDLSVTLNDYGFGHIIIEELRVEHPTETTMRAEVLWSLDPDDDEEADA